MRTFLSRVDDVFEIADRGCVVVPGIPRTSGARLRIGDTLWLKRPDGSEASTIVRGIEFGGPVDSVGIPILLCAELTKVQIPIGTLLSTDLTPSGTLVFQARAAFSSFDLNSVFSPTPDGHLLFGWSGRSRLAATTADLLAGPTEFIDYVMEGHVPFHLHASIEGDTLSLTILLHGSSRDPYVGQQVRHYLQQAGLIVDETEHTTSRCTGAAKVAKDNRTSPPRDM